MDENAISVLCAVSGCEWRVVGDERCPQHGGFPTYAWEPSIWGDDREFVAAGVTDPAPIMPLMEGAHR